MFTPSEVQDKKFPKAVFGGYDMSEVDDFLDALSTDYSALFKENTVLKSKLKVLAEKVEEYRSVDAAMRKALIVAQKMAAEMTEEAKEKSEEIRKKARMDYEESISALKDDIRNEERRLESIKDETRKFVEASVRIYQKQIEDLRRMISEPGAARNDIEEKAEEIEKSVSKAIEEESPFDEVSEDTAASGSPVSGVAYLPEEGYQAVTVGLTAIAGDPDEDLSVFGPGDLPLTPIDEEIQEGPEARETADSPQTRKASLKDKPREVNVGGMNIRVFEMDVGGDRPKK